MALGLGSTSFYLGWLYWAHEKVSRESWSSERKNETYMQREANIKGHVTPRTDVETS